MMKKIIFSFLLILFLFKPELYAQIDGEVVKPYKAEFLLQNARVYTITQGVLENTDLLIKDGKITAIGQNLAPQNYTLVDCSGKSVYPGFIDSGTSLGWSGGGQLSC